MLGEDTGPTEEEKIRDINKKIEEALNDIPYKIINKKCRFCEGEVEGNIGYPVYCGHCGEKNG